jgi:glycosyltransferase involved in cell wall biosynthesis
VTPIPNGVDVARFASAGPGTRQREEWAAGSEDFLIGFVGSLKPWHGIELLIEAFRNLRLSGQHARLVVIGDGPLRALVEQAADVDGDNARIILTGALAHDEMPQALQALDVLVAPYPEMEHFYFSPLKVYEYMAAGKPIVASRIGQIADLLEHERTALLAPPGDVTALATALDRLRSDRELGARLGQAAQSEALAHHSWQRRVTQWETLFAEVIAHRHAQPAEASA